jgi:hypothetical protein
MVADGYVITGYEGPTTQGGLWNRLPLPFEIASVRPDVFGICTQGTRIAVGEAKTAKDVLTQHTLRQLRVLGRLRDHRSGEPCVLYVAVPRSEIRTLDRVLVTSGLINAHHVIKLGIPDCLLTEEFHGER